MQSNSACVLSALSLLLGSGSAAPVATSQDSVCTVEPAANGGDSAPAIIEAFEQCGSDGKVVFKNETYNVASIMNTTGLRNCDVEVYGTLLVSSGNPPAATC